MENLAKANNDIKAKTEEIKQLEAQNTKLGEDKNSEIAKLVDEHKSQLDAKLAEFNKEKESLEKQLAEAKA